MNYQHVLFDLDGTLWDFHENSKDTLHTLFGEHQLAKYLNCDFETYYKSYIVINEQYWALFREDKIDKNELRYGRFNASFKVFDYDNLDLAKTVNDAYLKLSPYKIKLLEGTIDLLDYLRDKYTLHIVTNGFPEVQHIKMANTGLRPYFQELFISEEIGYNKPDKKIFEHIFGKLNTTAADCIMIGDSWEADIIGAMNVGMDYIHIGEKVQAHTVQKLEEIKALL
jgi:putative hydrolase of the HAD superfamily